MYRGGVVADGPYAESKDVIGSFTLLATDSLDNALKIAQESPFLSSTRGRIEVQSLLKRMDPWSWAAGTAVLWAMSYFFFRKLAPGESRAMLEPRQTT